MNSRLVDIATGVAISSEGTNRRNAMRVGALLFRKNRILAAKTNSYKTHPALSKYTKWPYLHAETSCILSHGLGNCADNDLLVVRVHRDNSTLSCAKPCSVCSELIKLAGIRKVWYSNWDGRIECYEP